LPGPGFPAPVFWGPDQVSSAASRVLLPVNRVPESRLRVPVLVQLPG